MANLNIVLKTYAGRRVLVTGHTGFKGCWLGLWLQQLGAQVMGVSLEPPSTPSMFKELELAAVLPGAHVSISDYGALLEVFRQFQPEVVLHLAAQALVRPSYSAPLATLQTNIMGTATLLEACRSTESVQAVVIVTSDKCYRNNEWVWGYRESDPMGGHDPYSVSKGCAELVAASYIKSFFSPQEYGFSHRVAVASARAGNAIGGGDWGTDRLVPDCIRAIQEGQPIMIRYPNAVRPWQHALECLSGYLLLGAKLLEEGPKFGCGWNFAPLRMGDVWPVERVVQYICKAWGEGSYVVADGHQPHEAHMLCLDCTKANIELEWRPRYEVEEALQTTVAWYKEWARHPGTAAMRKFTVNQIMAYMDADPRRKS